MQCCSLGGGLLGRLGGRVLEKSPSLHGLGLQVPCVGDEHVEVDDALAVEEHASDLSSGLTVLGLNELIDRVTNLLASSSWVERVEVVNVDRGQLRQVHLLLLLLLLLEHLHLVGGHLLLGSHTTSGHLGGLLLDVLVAVVATLTTVVVPVASAVVVEFAALAVVVTAITSVVVVALAIEVVVLAIVALAHSVAIHRLEGGSVQVLHEILLDFLETALLAFLMELISGHPELDREGAGAEGGGLVEALDSLLSAVDIFIEDEVLAVSSAWVEVFALAKLN